MAYQLRTKFNPGGGGYGGYHPGVSAPAGINPQTGQPTTPGPTGPGQWTGPGPIPTTPGGGGQPYPTPPAPATQPPVTPPNPNSLIGQPTQVNAPGVGGYSPNQPSNIMPQPGYTYVGAAQTGMSVWTDPQGGMHIFDASGNEVGNQQITSNAGGNYTIPAGGQSAGSSAGQAPAAGQTGAAAQSTGVIFTPDEIAAMASMPNAGPLIDHLIQMEDQGLVTVGDRPSTGAAPVAAGDTAPAPAPNETAPAAAPPAPMDTPSSPAPTGDVVTPPDLTPPTGDQTKTY